MKNLTSIQIQAIEKLKDTIYDIACANPYDDFICEECLCTIPKLLDILNDLTDDSNENFKKEIYQIIRGE